MIFFETKEKNFNYSEILDKVEYFFSINLLADLNENVEENKLNQSYFFSKSNTS